MAWFPEVSITLPTLSIVPGIKCGATYPTLNVLGQEFISKSFMRLHEEACGRSLAGTLIPVLQDVFPTPSEVLCTSIAYFCIKISGQRHDYH